MLPGKKYTPEDLLRILRRRVWLLLVPFAVVSAATAVYARRLPDLYRSQTLILVVPPRVPESFVRSTVASIDDRLPAIQQQILSRTRLERIITDLNLYTIERRFGIMEDIVDRMRRAISVNMVRGDAFTVGYVGGDPHTVMRVAERLSSLFIEESLRDREVLVEGTDQFLESQLEEAKRRLIETEKKREQYLRRFAGELPTQIEANLQAVQNRQLQAQTILAAVDRDQQQRLLVDRQLADLEATVLPPEPITTTSKAPAAATTAQQLNAARVQLATMLLTLKVDHPDVQRMNGVIRDLEKKLEAEALEAPVSAAGDHLLSPAEQQRQRRLADLRGQLEQLERQTARNLQTVEQLRKEVGEYQRRAESGPTRETEMVELNRDYNTLQSVYTSLLSKKEQSTIAANLERRQIGEQFKLVDPARLPQRPFSPNRQRMNLIGMAAGLAIGLALIALLEYRTVGLQTDDEVTAVLALPVLAVVPLMESAAERRRRLASRMALSLGLGGAVVGCLAIVVYTFVR